MAGMTIRFDTSQLRALERDLRRTAPGAVRETVKVVDRYGSQLQRGWVNNARRASGSHGKHYPNAITAEFVGPTKVEVGPESAMPQGGMGRGFEYGSRNQPPHMDGNQAADVVAPKFTKALPDAIMRLLERNI